MLHFTRPSTPTNDSVHALRYTIFISGKSPAIMLMSGNRCRRLVAVWSIVTLSSRTTGCSGQARATIRLAFLAEIGKRQRRTCSRIRRGCRKPRTQLIHWDDSSPSRQTATRGPFPCLRTSWRLVQSMRSLRSGVWVRPLLEPIETGLFKSI